MAYNFKSVADAQAQWANLDPAGQDAAHQYVVNANAKNGATYNEGSGQWNNQDYTAKEALVTNPTRGPVAATKAGADLAEQLTGVPYESMTQDEAAQYASNLANSKYDAAIQALRGTGDLLKTNYAGATGELDAMYGNRKQIATDLMQEAGTKAVHDSIERGGERGGLETYIADKMNKQIMDQLAQTEDELMAKKNTLRGNFDISSTNNLAAIQQALLDKGSFQSATAFEALQGDKSTAAQMQMSRDTLMAPFISQTADQKVNSDLHAVELAGKWPDNSAITALRNYSGNLGVAADWVADGSPNGMTTLSGNGKSQTFNDAQLGAAGLTMNQATNRYEGSQSSIDQLLQKYGLT